MPTDAELIARLNLVTDKLSTQVRTLAVGLLAFAGGLLVTGSVNPTGPGLHFPDWVQFQLFPIATLALLTLLCDVLQYVLLVVLTQQTRERLKSKIAELKAENASQDESVVKIGYDENSCAHRGSRTFFWLKISCLVIATGWLTIVALVFLLKK